MRLKKIIAMVMMLSMVITVVANELERDFRAVWVATAWGGIDFPGRKITETGNAVQIAAQKAEFTAMLDTLVKGNVNAIMFQVRSHGDAMYESSYEPWGHALSGTRGLDPGYDPFAFVLEEAHKRGIEVHAWVNPYRISNYTPNASQVQDGWIINAGTAASFLDPGNADVQDYTMDVLMEIIDNYDIDGLIFDDYFYKSMPANAYAVNETRQTSENNPYNLSIDDWRRENVNNLVKRVHTYLEDNKPYVRFGISPFGIYSMSVRKVYDATYTSFDNISPANGISGTDSYATMYCDAAAWMKRGYIDYISPQLYWPSLASTPTYKRAQDYEVLCEWWHNLAAKYNRPLIASNDVADNGSGRRFNPPADILNQLEVNEDGNKSEGSIFYNTSFFLSKYHQNTHFKRGKSYHTYLVETGQFAERALTPLMPWKGEEQVAVPTNLNFNSGDNKLQWDHAEEGMRFAIFSYPNTLSDAEGTSGSAYLVRVSYAKEMDLTAYTDKLNDKWAVKAYSRMGNLSEASVSSVPTNIDGIFADELPPVFSTRDGIRVEVEEEVTVKIYTVDGRLQYQDTMDTTTHIKLNKGIYVITLGDKSHKITVF